MENLIYGLFGLMAFAGLCWVVSHVITDKRKEEKKKIYDSTLGKG